MAQTVGQHGLASFTNPSNGDALDATVVKGNDNSVRDAYVDHDNDSGIHVQSSLVSARPVAGAAGRKWITTDTGSVRLWFDTGTAWEEVAYFSSAGGTIGGNTNVTGTLGVSGLITATSGVSGNLTGNVTGTVSGNAGTATTLQTARNINGVSFNGSADITVPAEAGTLTGSTLASGVTASSLTSVGTLTALTMGGTVSMADNVISRPRLTDYAETYTTPAISGGTLTLNLENGNVFRVSRNANISTLTISNPAGSGNACSFTLIFDANGTSYTITWPAAVKWPSGIAPTITTTASRSDVFTFYTNNAGTTWYAMTAAQNLVTT
jgi:hypothetical protein